MPIQHKNHRQIQAKENRVLIVAACVMIVSISMPVPVNAFGKAVILISCNAAIA